MNIDRGAVRKAVIVTNLIPGHDLGFEKSGHAQYLASFLSHLKTRGYEVVLLVVKPRLNVAFLCAGALPFRVRSRELRFVCGYLVQTNPIGTVRALAWYVFSRLSNVSKSRIGSLRSVIRKSQGYDHVLGRWLSDADRAYVDRVFARERPDLVLFDTVFNVCSTPTGAHSWTITHDVKHERIASFAAQKLRVLPSGFTAQDERSALEAVGNAIAIQSDDATAFRRLTPNVRVIVVPASFGIHVTERANPAGKRLIFVGSGSLHNADGLGWFLAEVWPMVRRVLADSELDVYGSVCTRIERPPAGVHLNGIVDDLAAAYGRADVAVVPLRIGSGLKVKLVEAITFGVPAVTTAVGAQGVTEITPQPFVVADGATDVAAACIALLTDKPRNAALSRACREAAKRFSQEAAFEEFDRVVLSMSSS